MVVMIIHKEKDRGVSLNQSIHPMYVCESGCSTVKTSEAVILRSNGRNWTVSEVLTACNQDLYVCVYFDFDRNIFIIIFIHFGKSLGTCEEGIYKPPG